MGGICPGGDAVAGTLSAARAGDSGSPVSQTSAEPAWVAWRPDARPDCTLTTSSGLGHTVTISGSWNSDRLITVSLFFVFRGQYRFYPPGRPLPVRSSRPRPIVLHTCAHPPKSGILHLCFLAGQRLLEVLKSGAGLEHDVMTRPCPRCRVLLHRKSGCDHFLCGPQAGPNAVNPDPQPDQVCDRVCMPCPFYGPVQSGSYWDTFLFLTRRGWAWLLCL